MSCYENQTRPELIETLKSRDLTVDDLKAQRFSVREALGCTGTWGTTLDAAKRVRKDADDGLSAKSHTLLLKMIRVAVGWVPGMDLIGMVREHKDAAKRYNMKIIKVREILKASDNENVLSAASRAMNKQGPTHTQLRDIAAYRDLCHWYDDVEKAVYGDDYDGEADDDQLLAKIKNLKADVFSLKARVISEVYRYE